MTVEELIEYLKDQPMDAIISFGTDQIVIESVELLEGDDSDFEAGTVNLM